MSVILDEYEQLQKRYNDAVAKILQLKVAGNALAAAYRTMGGLDVSHDDALRQWENING